MEIADLYPAWAVDKKYTAGQIVKHGVNSWNETQLYTVLKNHISKAAETPDTTPDLFKKVGVTDDGVPLWTPPLGKKDQYSKGDVVWHDGKKWTSTINNNAFEPGVQGWTEVAK